MKKTRTTTIENTDEARAALLKRPYAYVLTPDAEAGGYSGEVLEFDGCFAEGDTADEALESLRHAADGWIAAALEMGQTIPEPMAEQRFAGRIALRLPRSLHQKVARAADSDGVSVNQFIVAAIAEQVGYRRAETTATRQAGKAMQAAWNKTAFDQVDFAPKANIAAGHARMEIIGSGSGKTFVLRLDGPGWHAPEHVVMPFDAPAITSEKVN